MRAVFSLNHHRHDHRRGRLRRRRRRPTASLRRRRAISAKKSIQEEEDKEEEDKDEEEVTPRSLKVFLATRPLDGFERVHEILGGGKLYPKQLLHHATVVEMTTERSRWMTSAGSEPSEGTKEETSLHYLVDFAPKNALAVDTAFKLVVLRTSVRGVIRHEIVEKTFTNRYALSGIEQIGEVKRKSILEAAFDAANASRRGGVENARRVRSHRPRFGGRVLRVLRLAKLKTVRKRLQRFRQSVFGVLVRRQSVENYAPRL